MIELSDYEKKQFRQRKYDFEFVEKLKLNYDDRKKVIELVKEMILLLDLTDNFDRGKVGEYVVLAALALQIIPNGGYRFAAGIEGAKKSKKWWASIFAQRVNGDVEFLNLQTNLWESIDVKNPNWLSENSLTDFRNDGYFLIDAWRRPTQVDYTNGQVQAMPAMFKATKEAKDWIKGNVDHSNRTSGHPGYELKVSMLDGAWCFDGFDCFKYTKFMKEIWDAVDYWAIDPRNKQVTERTSL